MKSYSNLYKTRWYNKAANKKIQDLRSWIFLFADVFDWINNSIYMASTFAWSWSDMVDLFDDSFCLSFDIVFHDVLLNKVQFVQIINLLCIL